VFIAPDGRGGFLDSTANTTTTTNLSPISLPLDGKCSESVIDCCDNVFELLKGMAGRDSKPKTFLSTSDGGEIDGLDVNAVFLEKIIGCLFGLGSITDQDGDNVAWAGNDGYSSFRETPLHLTNIPLHELAISVIGFLIDDRRMGASDGYGRERGSEDEAWGVGPNHVDEFGGTSDITTNCAVCFSESAYEAYKRNK